MIFRGDTVIFDSSRAAFQFIYICRDALRLCFVSSLVSIMKQIARSPLYAIAATSAALAFTSTPALAQDAAQPAMTPTVTLPPPASPPSPTIVLPQVEAPAADPAPAAKSATAPSPVPRAERTARRAEPRATPAASARPTQAAEPAARVSAEPVAPAAVIAPEPVMQVPVAAERQPDAVRRPIDVPDELIGAAGLGVFGLGLAGLFAMRRRRRDEAEFADPPYEPAAGPAAEPVAEPLAANPASTLPAMASASAFAMPEGPVPTGAARQRLLDAMVAAPPDEANPFRSLPARRKRARIILQAREHRLREQATQPFDWRTYRSPTGVAPAHSPKVDA